MADSPSAKPSSQIPKFPIFNKSVLVLLLVLLICIFGIVRFNSSYPSIEAKPTLATDTLPGQFSVTFPAQGESAVGTENFGVIASTSNQTPVPIASVTKIMTAYLVLKAHPLQPGEEGPTLTMNAQDFADYQNDVKAGDSVLKISQ